MGGQFHEWVVAFIAGIVLLFLTPVLAPIVDVFWRLFRIPPQRLGMWILKARLSSAKSRLAKVRLMRADTRFLVFHCFWSLYHLAITLIVFSLCVLGVGLVGETLTVRVTHPAVPFLGQIIIIPVLGYAYSLVLSASNTAMSINDAVNGDDATVAALINQVETLKARVEA